MLSSVALFVLFTAGAYAFTNETNAELQASYPASAYVYNPVQAGNTINSPAGKSAPRMLEQWPTLAGQGIAQTAFVLNPCGLRPIHTHMRATGLLYVIQATNLSVGFTTEGGQLIQNYIQSGASAIFPQGLVHYQQNLACDPAYYTISYNSEDPGTQVTVPALEKLPTSVAAASLGLDPTTYQNVNNGLPKAAFVANSDPDCVAMCQSMGANTLAPAPILSSVSSAGR